jgi:hypothetical protein
MPMRHIVTMLDAGLEKLRPQHATNLEYVQKPIMRCSLGFNHCSGLLLPATAVGTYMHINCAASTVSFCMPSAVSRHRWKAN